MAKSALDSDRADASFLVKQAGNTDDGVEFEQRERRCWVLEIDLALFELLLERAGEGVRVDLEAHRQRGLRAHSASDAAVFLTGDRLVELKRVSPEGLAAESLVAEDLSALL